MAGLAGTSRPQSARRASLTSTGNQTTASMLGMPGETAGLKLARPGESPEQDQHYNDNTAFVLCLQGTQTCLAVDRFRRQPTCSAMCLGISPKLSELMRWSMLCRAPAPANNISPACPAEGMARGWSPLGVPAGCCSCPQMLLPSAEGLPQSAWDTAAAGEAAAAAEGVTGSEGPGLPESPSSSWNSCSASCHSPCSNSNDSVSRIQQEQGLLGTLLAWGNNKVPWH